MSMLVIWFKKTWVTALIAALGIGILPIGNASALSPSDLTTPGAPAQKSTDRLERLWSKEKTLTTKVGSFLNDSAPFITKAQDLINKAKTNGKDTTALQAALDDFTNAVNQAKPLYQSAAGIVSSHPGFDENGKVIDESQAGATVKDLASKLKGVRQILLEPRKTLREAIKAFRAANKPAATPTPTQVGG